MKLKKVGILLCAAMLTATAGTTVQAKDAGDYRDVKPGDWFYPYVEDVSEDEYMTGKSPTVFAPLDNLARAQLATVIYRIHEKPDTAYESRFPDVPDGTFYSVPVTWANTYGVITGYVDGKFGPSDDITREQLATMLYRYAVKLGYDTSESGDLSAFPDAGNVSDFAKEAMEWANGAAIITGDSGKLNPQGKVNRAVGATMIARFTNLIGTPSKPAHQHNWKDHVVTKNEWIPNIVTVDDYEERQVQVGSVWVCNCGEKVPAGTEEEHVMNHILKGEDDGGHDEPVYETQTVKVGSHTEDHGSYKETSYVDYQYCDCGAKR